MKSPTNPAPAIRESSPNNTMLLSSSAPPDLTFQPVNRNLSASLSCFSVPKGWFRPPGCISIWLFCSTGIISPGWMHLYLALLFHRDYFAQLNASLSDSFVPQGLFRPAECISIWLFCAAGIISPARMHPITGRPSIKTSLPGHSVNFRLVLL